LFRSINSRLLLTYFGLMATILGVVTLSLVFFLVRNPRLAREAETNLILAANALNRQSMANFQNTDAATLEAAAEQADGLLDVRVALISPSGVVLADSRSESEDPPPSEITVRRQGTAEIAEFRDSKGQTWIYTTRMLPKQFMLLVANLRPRAPLFSFFTDELFPPIWRAGLLALLLSLLVAFLMTRWITSPLQKVTGAAQALSKGKMNAIKPEGPTEIQALAKSFNEMGNKVTASHRSQRDFVANVSHELRTPLTSIQGFAQAILDGTASQSADIHRAAAVISTESARMQRLVDDLLELTRLDSGGIALHKQPIDTSSLIREVVQKIKPLAENAQITISENLTEKIVVDGDYDRLIQVFNNLLDNAVKYTSPGGKVKISSAPEKGFAKITVSDTGVGIPPNEMNRIFERFYRVDKSRKVEHSKGSGLGLSIAKQIVHAHHGSIEVKSELGKGSQFIIRLPLAE
jgi:two-component system OmpR family sensor kinase